MFSVLFCLSFVSSEWVDCWDYGPYGSIGNTPTECNSAGCVVTSSTGSVSGYEGDVVTDLWCGSDMLYCCLPLECWQWDATSESVCETQGAANGLNCTWDPYPATMYLPNGSSYTMNGSCFTDWDAMGEDSWGGVESGCWQYDGDKAQCDANAKSNGCTWSANNANQNPWCWIKTLGDAQNQNPLATTTDIGCCDMSGCWSYDGNETQCVNGSLAGACTWSAKANDPWCPDDVGCCYSKSCNEVGSNETLCNTLKTQMMMPCEFNSSGTGVCEDFGGTGGGFSFFNDTDTCMAQGGWYDINGNCQMPEMTGDDEFFMYGGEAHCWFADNQPTVCGNITGCAYCVAGSTDINGVDNSSEYNICYNKNIGWCEGHDKWGPQDVTNADNSNNLNCTHLKLKSACQFGPLPNCKWENSSSIVGEYCTPGTSTETMSAPPVPFCEHPDAKNNQTLCEDLASTYMMPCKWRENWTSVNGMMVVNCTFNPNAVFGGDSNTEKDFGVISSQTSCVASGGTWQTEYYLEDGILKQDSWCEKGALYDPLSGQANGNKGNCDTDCWACEFRYNGSNWENVTTAEAACVGSALGYCQWTNDSYAPNGQGVCNYPVEMSYGAGDCQSNCKDCDLMATTAEKYSACVGSQASCKWVNNTNSSGDYVATGYCVGQNKKTCADDCFSCYDEDSCFASTLSCSWDSANSLCSPSNFDGEICFDAVDNDNDGFMDCADPDCSFDNACGGDTYADCMSITDASTCNATVAFSGMNCSWYNFTWEPEGHCGMPGENCWQFDGDPVTCGATTGCTNESEFSGSGGFCDINTTPVDAAECWNYNDNETYCSAQANCGWVNDSWCENNPTDPWCAESGGWCDYTLFAGCMNLDGNSTACNANSNCTWHQEDWMEAGEGFCDPACFQGELNETTCVEGNLSGVCQWRSAGDMCMPSTFDMMAGGTGGKVGCPQYDGNMTACNLKNATCVWITDTGVENNVSASETSGWCNDKATYEMTGDMKGDMIFLGMDSDNEIVPMVGPSAETGIEGWADIMGFGMRVTDKSYGFGVGMFNLTEGIVCNGYNLNFPDIGVTTGIGSGSNITKIVWYIDTNECYDTDQGTGGQPSCAGPNYPTCGANLEKLDDGTGTYATGDGFEFKIKYMVRNNTNTGNVETTKKLYRCVQNSSSGWNWVPTNVFLTDDKKFTCWDSQAGAVFVSVEKESLENFPEFDITSSLAIFAISYNGTGSGDAADGIGPGYYTPGTIDFGFVDCSDPNTKDAKCKNFQKYGTQIFEDCKNGADDDGDGYADCDDAKCKFTPACTSGTAFDWDYYCATDFKAPTVTFTQLDKMADSAIVKYDTGEPANGTLYFYGTNSGCTTTANATINDVGSASWSFDDYKPFHRATIDNDSLGYLLANNTAYYYKLKVCDGCGNCGTSACLNFTTKEKNKPFIFKMDLPEGYTVNITGGDGTPIYNGSFTYEIAGTTYEIGVKTNHSVAKDMNITINKGDLSMKFIGADLYKPKTLNLEGAFIADEENEILGMNSTTKAWNFLLSDLSMGGSGDAIELNFPVAYDSGNKLNWTNDEGTTGNDVSDYVNCSDGGSSNTLCQIPTSLGFSQYYLTTVTNDDPDDDSPSSSGGSTTSGSIGGALYIISSSQLEAGYTRTLVATDRIQFNISLGVHTFTLDEVSNDTKTVKVTVSSDPQTATMSVGDVRRFELSGDNYYDLSVTLNSITGSLAEIVLKKISEEVTSATEDEEQEKETEARKDAGEESDMLSNEQESSNDIWYILAAVVLAIGLFFLGIKLKEIYSKRFHKKVNVLDKNVKLDKPLAVKKKKPTKKKK